MSKLWRFWDQSLRIPKPTLTESNLPDQQGRVVIITGGYTGVGFELSKILYQHNATICIAGRDQQKADKAIKLIKDAHPASNGRLQFLLVDLSDLQSVKSGASRFAETQERLDVLVNNGERSMLSLSYRMS
jgi:retinol dehydrogenase 12